MKFNDAFDILKTIEKAVNDPNFIADSIKKSQLFNFPIDINTNKDKSNNVYAESEATKEQADKNISSGNNINYENNSNYTDYENADYYDKSKGAFSNEKGLLDSITQDITSARLQQAIILSEIVGKPKCKTRKRRRF
jgi:hypothetical protein